MEGSITKNPTFASSTLLGLGWTFWICFPKLWFDVKTFSQNVQSNCLSFLACVLLCCLRLVLFVNTFLHVSHLNSPLGAALTRVMFVPQSFMCLFRLSFLLKTVPHASHGNCMSWCVLICLFRTALTKVESQISHFTFLWNCPMWFFSKYAVVNVFSQSRQFDSCFLWY